jgi:hypothetical protein
LAQAKIEYENFDFDSVDIDATVVKAEPATCHSTRRKGIDSAPEAKGLVSVAILLKSMLQ